MGNHAEEAGPPEPGESEEKVEATITPEEWVAAAAVLKELLSASNGCVSSLALKKSLESRNVANARALVVRLKYYDFEAPGDDQLPKPQFRWYSHAKSFYSKERFDKLQTEKDRLATEAAEQEGTVEIRPEKDAVPERKKNKQEEGRLGTYIESALQDIYESDYVPDDAECVFDVHNERGGSDFENIDLLAVHWRSEKVVELISVEVKLEFSARLVQQARNYCRFSDRVWIAVPVRADPIEAAAELRDLDNLLFEHVIESGIGILACRRRTGRSYQVVPVHWPRKMHPDPVEREQFLERYRREFERAAVLAPRSGRAYPRVSW
jgi:hypothetical protein